MQNESPLDWTQPLETVPTDLNPVAVPCRFLPDYSNTAADEYAVFIDGDWESPADRQGNVGNEDWWFNKWGIAPLDRHWLPDIRNVVDQ